MCSVQSQALDKVCPKIAECTNPVRARAVDAARASPRTTFIPVPPVSPSSSSRSGLHQLLLGAGDPAPVRHLPGAQLIVICCGCCPGFTPVLPAHRNPCTAPAAALAQGSARAVLHRLVRGRWLAPPFCQPSVRWTPPHCLSSGCFRWQMSTRVLEARCPLSQDASLGRERRPRPPPSMQMGFNSWYYQYTYACFAADAPVPTQRQSDEAGGGAGGREAGEEWQTRLLGRDGRKPEVAGGQQGEAVGEPDDCTFRLQSGIAQRLFPRKCSHCRAPRWRGALAGAGGGPGRPRAGRGRAGGGAGGGGGGGRESGLLSCLLCA